MDGGSLILAGLQGVVAELEFVVSAVLGEVDGGPQDRGEDAGGGQEQGDGSSPCDAAGRLLVGDGESQQRSQDPAGGVGDVADGKDIAHGQGDAEEEPADEQLNRLTVDHAGEALRSFAQYPEQAEEAISHAGQSHAAAGQRHSAAAEPPASRR